jgi:hypothetical protein
MERYKLGYKKNKPTNYRYLLKNITKYDVCIGDLAYKIPAGQTRDLLGKNARLKVSDIAKSRHSGSLKKRIGRTLVEVDAIINPKPPLAVEADPSIVAFPQRVKSCITIEVGDITDEIDNLAINEDEEFLKQMEAEELMTGEDAVPIVAKTKEKEDENAKETKAKNSV